MGITENITENYFGPKMCVLSDQNTFWHYVKFILVTENSSINDGDYWKHYWKLFWPKTITSLPKPVRDSLSPVYHRVTESRSRQLESSIPTESLKHKRRNSVRRPDVVLDVEQPYGRLTWMMYSTRASETDRDVFRCDNSLLRVPLSRSNCLERRPDVAPRCSTSIHRNCTDRHIRHAALLRLLTALPQSFDMRYIETANPME